MAARNNFSKPAIGMRYRFRVGATPSFADIPVRVVHVWPRFRSGDYLLTLEYDRPAYQEIEELQQFEAFLSELEPIPASGRETSAATPTASSRWSALAASCARRLRLREA